jgi:hypothetical protein
MVYFQTKDPNLGKFGRVLQWNMLIYYIVIWSILWPFYIFDGHVLYFMVIYYISPRFCMLCHEKSGNPVLANRMVSHTIKDAFHSLTHVRCQFNS